MRQRLTFGVRVRFGERQTFVTNNAAKRLQREKYHLMIREDFGGLQLCYLYKVSPQDEPQFTGIPGIGQAAEPVTNLTQKSGTMQMFSQKASKRLRRAIIWWSPSCGKIASWVGPFSIPPDLRSDVMSSA